MLDSLRKRYAPTEIVDEVIGLWNDAYQSMYRASQWDLALIRAAARYKATQVGAKINAVQKEIGKLKKVG